jgi:hypothetical protein
MGTMTKVHRSYDASETMHHLTLSKGSTCSLQTSKPDSPNVAIRFNDQAHGVHPQALALCIIEIRTLKLLGSEGRMRKIVIFHYLIF